MEKLNRKIYKVVRVDFETITWVFFHTRISYTSLVGGCILDVGPAANHSHMKVSDALR